MKVALATDFLTSRNHYTKTIQSFIELYPDCELFTLAHIPGEIDEFIEQRKITSSFLSRFVKTEDDLDKYFFLFQAAAQSIFIPCGFDKIIYITSGFALSFKCCSKSKTYLYQYNDLLNNRFVSSKKLLNKFFKAYIFNRGKTALDKYLGKHIGHDLLPPFSVKDIPLFPRNIKATFKENYISINMAGVNKSQFDKSLEYANQIGKYHIIVFGDSDYKYDYSDQNITFHSEIDPVVHATIFASSKCIIDLSHNYWPSLAMIAIKMQIPAIICANWKEHTFFNTLANVYTFSLFESRGQIVDYEKVTILDNMGFKRKIKNQLGF